MRFGTSHANDNPDLLYMNAAAFSFLDQIIATGYYPIHRAGSRCPSNRNKLEPFWIYDIHQCAPNVSTKIKKIWKH